MFARILPYKRFLCNSCHNILYFQKNALNRKFSPRIRQKPPKNRFAPKHQTLQKYKIFSKNRSPEHFFRKICLFNCLFYPYGYCYCLRSVNYQYLSTRVTVPSSILKRVPPRRSLITSSLSSAEVIKS